jgi:Kef-type K+ transport system membrane component KefB
MTLLLMQVAIVLLVTASCGWLARRIGQARVIGEIIGGILIGPSVLGRLAPELSARFFNEAAAVTFDSLSTVGLILFLFLVGMELDPEKLYQQRMTAVVASAMSISLPFSMAALLAPFLRVRFVPQGVGAGVFVLFLGIAMSITAFPVLARILEERRLQRSRLGTTAILCAAVDDVTAWTLLAVALALIGKGDGPANLSIRLVGLGLYLLLMLGLVRPLARWLAKRGKPATLSVEWLSLIVVSVLLSAAATNAIGVHPLFGAFLAGLCVPRIPGWHAQIRLKLDTITSVLLLPLFFALTGMRTRLDLLSSGSTWFWTGIILVAAVAGKMGGAVLAARWSGESWLDAWALGALLNTRGLVELIVLNVAYKAGVFSPTLFTMLVVMALFTTLMTIPLLNMLGVENRGEAKLERGNAARHTNLERV